MTYFIAKPEPFIVEADSREAALRIARKAVRGSTLSIEYIDDADGLIDFAAWLTKNKK